MQVTTTTQHADAALLHRAAEGDDAALRELLELHLQAVRAWLLRRCGQVEIADELAMDAFLPQRLRNFAGQSAPRTFLIGIAHNLWLHRRRDLGRERRRDVRSLDQLQEAGAVDVADPAPAHGEQLAQRELADRILSRLDAREQQIFHLRYQLGWEFAEIAEAIGETSVDTVRSLHRRTLLRLRDEWTDAGKDFLESTR